MFNLNYTTVAAAYRRYAALDQEALFEALGWTDKLCTQGYVRNGAVLTSLALLASRVPVNGALKIEAGPLAGGKVQHGANRLADWLAMSHSAPEILPLDQCMGKVGAQLFGRRGLVAFIEDAVPAGGFMALVNGCNAGPVCHAAERRPVSEVRFWALS